MHILIIHQAFASLDEPGGTRHYELARLLAASGHTVTVIASPVSYITGGPSPLRPSPSERSRSIPKRSEGRDGGDGITILRARVYSAHHKSFLHRMLAFFSFMISAFWIGLGVRQPDLVWGTSPPIFQGGTAWMLARLRGARFLFEVRDLWPQFAIAAGVLENRWLISASIWLERALYRGADCVVVNSPGFVTHVRASGAKRIELISNGADPAMFDPAANGAEFRRTHGLDGRFVALYAGAHGMSNDLQIVLAAAELLRGAAVQIVLVGDGKDKPALVERARELALTNVTFVSSVPKREMLHVLAAADAGIAILKPLEEYKTTYPNKVFDYMAAGRPVILVIDGVIREVVEAAGCGVFVKPGSPAALADAIRSLAADPELARHMGENGRRYLGRHFSREQTAMRLLQVLKATVEE